MTTRVPKNQAFSLGAVKRIQEICKPLNKQALVHFTHDVTFGKGQISMLMNDKKGLIFYFRNKFPAVCTDETGRTLESGVYLGKVLKEYYKDVSIIMPKLPFAQSTIHICKREANYQQLYSFYFDLKENDFLQWVVNSVNSLTDFIENYNLKACDIISEAVEPENRTVLPLYTDISHQLETSKPYQIKILHKDNHQAIYLAQQQSICLKLLAKGKTAKQIAKSMNLSRRTVEHYLERIRKLLGCNSNMELLASYSEQLYLQELLHDK